ncbi:MAG: TonB-dependent receptor [Woeseiaceae bacterium]|nr:TonB-dependent receptor [Woeseiaceae bacterium]
MKRIGTSILNLGRMALLPLAGLIVSTSASAQEADAGGILEEITVVAQKREQNIMDVPVAITAVTGAQIENAGIKDMIDLQLNVPGLIVGGSQTTTTSNFSIRGIGSTSNNFGVESSVGLYVDGVYRSRQSSLINELVDVEAVEVLRGPQGTLFGKNTAAGAIQVRTVAPSTDSYDAFIDVTAGSLDLQRISGAVNIPLTDNLAFRGTVFSSQRDGYVDNLIYDLSGPVPSTTVQEDLFNDRDRFGVRLQVGYDNGDDFNLRVIGDYSEIDEICCIGTSNVDSLFSHGEFQATGGTAATPGPDFIRMGLGSIVFTDFPYGSTLPTTPILGVDIPTPPNVIQGVSWDDYVTSVNFAPVSQNEDRGISVEFNKDFANATLTSVTAYRAFDTYDLIDADFTDTSIAERENQAEQTSVSQELRLAGTFGESSNWVVGAYYFAQEIKSNTITIGGTQLQAYADAAQGNSLTALRDAVTALSVATGGLVPPGAEPFPAGAFANDNVTQDHDGFAVFGQVDWALSDALTLTLGARFTDETKDINAVYTQTNPGVFRFDADETPGEVIAAITAFQIWAGTGMMGPPPDLSPVLPITQPGWAAWTLPPFSPRPDVVETLEDDQVTGTAKLTWFANDSSMLYLSYATGFKSGGTNADRIEFDPDDPTNPLFSQLFDAESSTSIELGFKGDIGDRFRLSASIYQTDFDDFQANTFEGSGFILRNAGDLEIKGVELEWLWQVMDNTSVTGYYARNEGEYITFENGVAWDATPFHDPTVTDDGNRSGESLPYNPEDRFMIALTQDFPMGNNNLFFRAEYAWASDTTTDGDNDPLTVQDDFGILNVRLGVDLDEWNSTVTLWGRNVTDERYYNGSFDPPLLDNGRLNSYPSEVATYGLTFRKNWD